MEKKWFVESREARVSERWKGTKRGEILRRESWMFEYVGQVKRTEGVELERLMWQGKFCRG